MKLINKIFVFASSLVIVSAIFGVANAKFPVTPFPANEKQEVESKPQAAASDNDQDKVAFMEVF